MEDEYDVKRVKDALSIKGMFALLTANFHHEFYEMIQLIFY